ncbi:MAG: TonB-dependent receptor plug domain-containing protein [Pseudobdellovibrionaceae bacterium]|nr:TonB-dependent receptor plug domain-containing protein [Pseudobdellovibrionaceae bacterium]
MTASRVPEDVRTLPASVTIISRQDIEQVADAGQGLGFVLARLAPGMGPETNSVSNFGQQLQGRKVLILIDGIPQSENRQVSRQLNTIQLSSIQRIEIISGATAMYGADAIGGVINIITRDYAEVPLQNHARVNVSGSDQASFAAGGAWQVEHAVSGALGASHYLVNASVENRASTFDAQGDLIPPEPAQTSRDQVQAIDALLKYAYDFSDDRRLELSFSAYHDQQDLDYTVAIDPYRAEHGLKLDDQPLSERRQLPCAMTRKILRPAFMVEPGNIVSSLLS